MTHKKILSKMKSMFARLLQRPEYVYLSIALVALVGFVFITPPFQGPDEELHYLKVQYISQGYFVPSDEASVPVSINDVTQTTFYKDDIRGKTNQTYELARTIEALKVPLNSSETYKPVMLTYNSLLYLPAVPGVVVSNALNLSPLVSMYVARLSLGLASIAMFFFAIRFIPHKKYLLVAVGLIPTVLFQQAMITADSASYAVLALFIAYILYLREKREITAKQWVLTGVLSLGVIFAKPLVFLFLPLVLLLVKKRHAWRWLIGIVVACAVGLLGWNSINGARSGSVGAVAVPSAVNNTEQLNMLISDPGRGLRVGWNSYMTSYGDEEVRGVIGIFGAADTIYPLWMTFLYVIMLAIAAFVILDTKKSKKIDWRWKVFAVLLCLAYFGAVNLALYLGYTPVNFDIVYGVQGRYFIPIMIILAAMIFSGGVKLSKSDTVKTRIGIILSIATLVILALFITYQRYYLYTP